MVGPEDILPKLPRHTPAWAIGITSVAVSFALCLGSIYVVIRPDIQSYLTEYYKTKELKIEQDSVMISNILGIVKSDTEQITFLSSRVTTLEKELIELRSSIETKGTQKKGKL